MHEFSLEFDYRRDLAQIASFYDTEDIVAKVHSIHELEKLDPYRDFRPRYWQRIKAALAGIPPQHKFAALALFANVVYVSRELMDEAMRKVCRDVTRGAVDQGFALNDVHLFTVDDPGLVEIFYDAGGAIGWKGRLDATVQRDIRRVSSLLDRLLELPHATDQNREQLRELFRRKIWVVLTDNSFSGGSLVSDLQRLNRLRSIFDMFPVNVFVASEIITDQALQGVTAHLLPGDAVHYGLRFDDRFAISNEACALFNRPETLQSVRQLCEWFGAQFFDDEYSGTLLPTLKKHRARGGRSNFSYGWYDGGYTIVTYRNCPTNSVPLLWYPSEGETMRQIDLLDPNESVNYSPPFKRLDSRLRQSTGGDSEKLKQVETQAHNLCELLCI